MRSTTGMACVIGLLVVSAARARADEVTAAPVAPAAPVAEGSMVAWKSGLVFWTADGARVSLAGRPSARHVRIMTRDPAATPTGEHVAVVADEAGTFALYVRNVDLATVATRPAMLAPSAKKAVAQSKAKKPPAVTLVGVHLDPGAELEVLERKDGAARVALRSEDFNVEGWIAESSIGPSYLPAAPPSGVTRRSVADDSNLLDKPGGTPLLVITGRDTEVIVLAGRKKGHTLARVDGAHAHMVGWLADKNLGPPVNEPHAEEPAAPPVASMGGEALPAGTSLSDSPGGPEVIKLPVEVRAQLGSKSGPWQQVTLFTTIGTAVAWTKTAK